MMKVKDFQYINSLDSGSTTYETDLIEYFHLDISKSYTNIQKELAEVLQAEPVTSLPDKIKLNGKWYGVEKDLLECEFEQYIQMDKIIAEDDNIKNLHRLLAIFVRPLNRNWIGKLNKLEKYDIKKQDYISNDLLELDINIGLGYMVFFYHLAMNYMKHINISYLNQKRNLMKV